MLKQIVLGLLFMGIGSALIYFSAPLVNLVGKSEWAEKNLGGTRNAVILFGFVVIVLGVLFMFGVLQSNSPTDVATPGF